MTRIYTDGKYRYLIQRANSKECQGDMLGDRYYILKEAIYPTSYGISGKPRYKTYHAESSIYYDTAEEAQQSLDFVAEQRAWQPFDD